MVSSAQFRQLSAQTEEGKRGPDGVKIYIPQCCFVQGFLTFRDSSPTSAVRLLTSQAEKGPERGWYSPHSYQWTAFELSSFMGGELEVTPGSFPFLKLTVSKSCVTMPITLHFEIHHSSFPCSLHLVLVLPKETFSFLPSTAVFALFASLFYFFPLSIIWGNASSPFHVKNKSKKGKESMFWYFVLCKHILQDKHILSIKEENNFLLYCYLQAAAGWWNKQFLDMVKSSMWKTRLLNVPDKIAFQTPDLDTSKLPVIPWPLIVWLKKKNTLTRCLKGPLCHGGVAVPHARACQCPKSD